MKATYLAVILFFVFVSLNTPVSVSLLLGIVISVAVFDLYPLISTATLFYGALDSYLLVAIPLFMLAGSAMSYGGIAHRIFNFSESILGFLPGSLGSVNVMGSVLFSGMSGSSVADIAGLGPIEIREMVKRNYPLPYATAITLASSTLAVIIPPSILMIIYASIANVSVGKSLAAGLLPGMLIALLLVALNTWLAVKKKWSPTIPFSLKRVLSSGISGIPEIMTGAITGLSTNPLIIMLLMNIVLLLAGMFLNPGFSIIVFTPLLLPLARAAGFEPLHFGVIMVANLALGLITPPVGACLYIGSVISGVKVERLIRELIPFYLILLLGLIAIILLPQLSQGFADLIYR